MYKYSKQLCIAFLGVFQIVSSNVNFPAYIKGYMPDYNQFIFSILCLLVWVCVSFFFGYQRDIRYIVGGTMFWVIGAIPVPPLVLLVSGPIYGLRYIILLHPGYLLLVVNAIAYALVVLSYYSGYLLKNKKIKSERTES